jgi:hypothetical protein
MGAPRDDAVPKRVMIAQRMTRCAGCGMARVVVSSRSGVCKYEACLLLPPSGGAAAARAGRAFLTDTYDITST